MLTETAALETLQKIEKHILQRYKHKMGSRTSQWSWGNYDDVFSDGEDRGECWSLYNIASIIGIDLQKPDEQEFE